GLAPAGAAQADTARSPATVSWARSGPPLTRQASPPSDQMAASTNTDEAAVPSTRKKGGVAASSLVAFGIFLSRISGLVRESVFAHFFGVTLYADVFRAGLRLPNALQNLLGEGTLSASFIPVYAELLERGRKVEAVRVAGAVFALVLALAAALALVGIVFVPLLVSV